MQTFTRLLAVVATTLFCSTAFAQTGKPRVSPAQTESYTIGQAKITINYSSPSVREVDVSPRVSTDSTEVLAYTITHEGFALSWEKLVIPVPVN